MWGNLPEIDDKKPMLAESETNTDQTEIQESDFDRKLLLSVKDTLENMTFSSVESTILFYAKIHVLSPLKGCFTIILSEQLAKTITATMYALSEEEIVEATVIDTVAELANTISGQLIESLIPESQTFELSVPDTGKARKYHFSESAFVWPYLTNGEAFTVGIEGRELLEKINE